LLCGSSTEDQGWRVHMEWTSDQGRTWQRSAALNDGKTLGAIQPTILQHAGERLQILCRSRGVGKIVQAWSDDLGASWSGLEPTALPNPNSGLDAVTLRDGRHVLVYNHTRHSRSPLNVAISPDGQRWFTAASLETRPGEYSYPAIVQGPNGLIHVSYTWQRRKIRHVVLDPDKFPLREIIDGAWPQ
jgi:predicted neuraminidase